MPGWLHTVLVFFLLLAASVWVGGYVTVIVVTRIARAQLEPRAFVPFFRSFGQGFGRVTGVALLVAILTGLVLLIDRGWDAGAWVATVLAVAIAVATAVGVRQARAIGALRRKAMADPADESLRAAVEAGAARALALRATLGVLSLALLAVGAILAT